MDTYTFRFNVEKYTEEAIKNLEEVKEISDLAKQIIPNSYSGQNYCGAKCALQGEVNNLTKFLSQQINSLSSKLKPYAQTLKDDLEKVADDVNVFLSSPDSVQRIIEYGNKLEGKMNTNSIEEQIQSQQQQLRSQIMNLEQNPTKNQTELATKKKKLVELETKEKELTQSLPLTTQITILEREIKTLTQKPTRTQTEEAFLTSKKKELAELLAKQNSSNTNTAKPSDKTAFILGCGIIAVVLISLVLILVRKNKNKKH
jgi:hypothetical protein